MQQVNDNPSSKVETRDVRDHKLRLYLIGLGILVVLAVASLLLVPRGNSEQRCMSALFESSRYGCIQSAAVESMNSSLCSYLPNDSRYQCYDTIAQGSNNATVCGMINDSQIRNSCIQAIVNVTSNPSLCLDLNSSYRNSCFFGISIKLDNSAMCNDISDQNMQHICNSTVNFKSAVSSGRGNLCSTIDESYNSNVTYAIFNNATIGNANFSTLAEYILSYSEFIPNTTIGARDLCYISVAYVSKSNSTCSNIHDSNLSSMCNFISKSSVTTKTNITGNVTSQNYTQILDACYQATQNYSSCNATTAISKALQTDNITTCHLLNEPYYDYCYSYFSQFRNNESYCAYVKNSTANSACIYAFTYGRNTTGGG